MAFKYQNKTLPRAIIKLFDDILYENNIITRKQTSCDLRPKKELKAGDLLFDIIDSWNKIGPLYRNEKTLKSFKNKITSHQNRYAECDKTNCYSCA